MIIHSYCTQGYYPWAKIFLESFKLQHNENYKIILSTRDLSNDEVEFLKRIYSNLEVRNKILDLEEISLKSGVDIFKLKQYKEETEHGIASEENKIWKQAISVEDRYRDSIVDVMQTNMDEKYLIHFDIDLLFRKPLNQLFEIISTNDITIRFRLQKKIARKVCGGLIGFKLDDKIFHFMHRWKKYIDEIPLNLKPLGYGQTSFYYAYEDLKDYYKWGTIPSSYLSTRHSHDDEIYSANTIAGKDHLLKFFRSELNKISRQRKNQK
jgi:hypothetical protein